MITRARAAQLLWIAAMASVAAGGVLSAVGGGPLDDVLAGVVIVPAAATVGALIFARVPRNPIGWIFLGVGLAGGLRVLLAGYADLALLAGEGSRHVGDICADATRWLWAPVTLVPVTFGLLLFPHGRLTSRGQRALVSLAGLGITSLAAFVGVSTADEVWRSGESGKGDSSAFLDVLGTLIFMALVPALIGSVATVITRFRRSSGEERHQLKWLTYGGSIAAAVLGVAGTVFDEQAGVSVVVATALASFPIWIGIAILRYRLYDIDVVINRTLVYGALTATLAGAYLATVLVLQLALRPLTESSNLAIAGSTLAVAALFRPARARIQTVVDRRFYRRKYDAQRTLEAFSGRLREQVDLSSLRSELSSVVRETLQPTHVSLWLRAPEVSE